MRSVHTRRVRFSTTVALFLAVLAGTLSAPGAALAGLSGCRADPVVTLTNGTIIQMEASIDTRLANVDHIEYIVHAPAGTRVLLTVYTDGLLGLRERVYFHADRPAHEYTITTIVYTRNNGVNITARSRVVELLGIDMGSARGRDRQHINVNLYP